MVTRGDGATRPSVPASALRGLAAQYAHTFAFALVRVVSHAVLIVMLGRLLSVEQYGVYALIANAIPVGVTLIGLELYAYLAREIPGRPIEESAAFFKGAFRFQAVSAFILVAFVLATGLDGTMAAALKLTPYRAIVRLGLILFPLPYLQREIARYFIATKRIEVSNISQFLCTNVWAYGLLLAVLLGAALSLQMVFVAWLAGAALSVLYAMIFLSRDGLFTVRARPGVIRKGLTFSLPLLLGAVGFQLNNVSGRYVISYFGSLAEAGGFSFLQTLVTTGGVLTYTIVESIIRPRIVEADNVNDRDRRNMLLNHLLRYSLVLVVPVMLTLLLAGRELLQLISQPEYSSYLMLTPYFAATTLIMAAMMPYSAILFLQRRTPLLGLVNLSGAAANIGLSLVLVPSRGAVGAALAGLIAFGGVLIVLMATARSAGSSVTPRRSRLLPVAGASGVTACMMAAGRAALRAFGWPGGPAVAVVSLGGLGALAFAAACWLLGAVEPYEKARTIQLLRRSRRPFPQERITAQPEGDVFEEIEP